MVGYHADAAELAPKGWLGGSEWDWADLYNDVVKVSLTGDFTGSIYNANYRVGYKDGKNPFIQSEFGPSVTAETKEQVAEAKTEIDRRDLNVNFEATLENGGLVVGNKVTLELSIEVSKAD